MKLSVFVITMMIYPTSILAVPFTFTEGTKAKASEVNANFNALTKRLDGLKAPELVCVQVNTSNINLSYVQKIGPLGKTFLIGTSTYKLIKAPFKDIASGIKYSITFPFALFSVRGLKTARKDMSNYCWNTNVAGYPARTTALKFEREMTFITQTNINIDRALVLISYDIEILVGETIISFEVSGAVSELSTNFLVDVPNDYTGEQQYTNMVIHQDIINAIDDMIDYISIEKLP